MLPVQTDPRRFDKRRADKATYLPLWNYVMGFPTSIRQKNFRNTRG
jgi:hypothetical protein